MITLDASDVATVMRSINRSLKQADGGKLMKREVSKALRNIAKPLAAEQKARVLRLPSKGHSGPSMRQAVARQTRVNTRWGGKNAGIAVVQRARGMPRDFQMAGRMFNREEGWNPQNLTGETFHQQMTPAKWFDEPTKGMRPEMRHEVAAALEEVADKMAAAAHRG